MKKLPAELLDTVFAQFDVSHRDRNRQACRASSRKSLRSCSLVCRDWTPFAQSRLFRDVLYVLEADLDDEDLGDVPFDVDTELEAIYAFFDTHRDLAACVRNLGITVSPVLRDECWFLPPETHQLESTLLCNLLSITPRVECLDLQDIVLKPSFRPLERPRFALKVLRILITADNTRFSDILCLLSYFTDIDFLDLTIIEPCRRNDFAEPLLLAANDLTIYRLAFESSTCGALCRHLAQSRSARTLHSLTLTRLSLRDMAALESLLDATKPNLIHLSLSFLGVLQAEPGSPPCLDLARARSLQSLELSVLANRDSWHAIWRALATLSAAHNRALRDVTLVMRRPGRFPVQDAWTTIPQAVLHTTYATLCALREQGSFQRFTFREQGNGLGRTETDMFPHAMRRYVQSSGSR